MTDIPEVLREFIRPDEDDDTSIRLPAREGNRRIGMLTIPDIQYQAWKTFFPQGMEKGPQSRYRQSRRVFFAVDDLPADAPTSVFLSGFPSSMPAGEWIGNPPAELPAVSYADITRLLGTPAPKSQPTTTTPAYTAYLSTDAEKNAAHGIFVVTPDKNPKDAVHTTKKRPETQGRPKQGEGGVKSLGMAAAAAVKTTSPTRLLGRRFGAGDGVIGIDCDGWIPTNEWTNGTGYREISASGTGAHIIARIPAGIIPPEGNKYKRPHGTGDIEIFYGRGNGIALTGKNATAGPIDLDMNSECGRAVKEILSGDRSGGRDTRQSTAETPAGKFVSPPREEIDAVATKYEPLIRDIFAAVSIWHPHDGPMRDTDDASSRMMAVCNFIVGKLRAGGFPVASDNMTITIVEGCLRKSSVWKMFYENGKHDGHTEKVIRTIRAAIDYTAPPPPPMPVAAVKQEEEDEPPEPEPDYAEEDAVIKSLMDRAPEPLKALVKFYNSISVIKQPLFALVASIAAAGVVLSRNWMTAPMRFSTVSFQPSTLNNYYMFIAPTARGKETIKTFIRALFPPNKGIESARGMSVDTALHTALQCFPRFVLFIDEAGRRAAESIADPNKSAVESMLMDIYGTTGDIVPQRFSQGRDSPYLQPITRHGLTVIRTTTQITLMEALSTANLEDGSFARNIVCISNRERPADTGEMIDDDEIHPSADEMLMKWDMWRKVHIGRPYLDTYRQSISPLSVIKDEINPDALNAAREMRMRSRGKPPKPPYTTERQIQQDPPITIEWTTEAKREIRRLYVEIEKLPEGNKYKPVNDRKLQHIIKIAGIIALLDDGISLEFWKIKKKYEESAEGKAAIDREITTRYAMGEAGNVEDKAREALSKLSEEKETTDDTAEEATKEEAITAAEDALRAAKEAHQEARAAWEEAKDNLNNVVTIRILGEKLDLINKIRIGKRHVEWGESLLNLCEVEAKRLVLNDIVDGGFMEIEELVRARLKKSKNGILPLSILMQCIKPLRTLDKQGKSKQFWEYMDSEGFKRILAKGGTSWALPIADMPEQEKKPAETETKTTSQTEKRGTADIPPAPRFPDVFCDDFVKIV